MAALMFNGMFALFMHSTGQQSVWSVVLSPLLPNILEPVAVSMGPQMTTINIATRPIGRAIFTDIMQENFVYNAKYYWRSRHSLDWNYMQLVQMDG